METYLVWYVVSQFLLMVTVMVRPSLYFPVPTSVSDTDGIYDARKNFTELVTTSLFPLAREFMIINGFFAWLATKRFPTA